MDLKENFKNLFSDVEKDQYKHIVWEMLQNSYRSIGGIKGNGFQSPDDMVKNIKMWKLYFKAGVLHVVVMYKDKSGRKLVALGTSGSSLAKTELKKILAQEFDRSYMEVSESLLKFMVKEFGQDYIAANAIENTKYDPPDPNYCKLYPKLCQYLYSRTIGGQKITKIMVGKQGLTIESFTDFLNKNQS